MTQVHDDIQRDSRSGACRCSAARALERLTSAFFSFAESAVREPETRIAPSQAAQYEELIIAAQEAQEILRQLQIMPNEWREALQLRRCVKCREIIIPETWEDCFKNLCEACFKDAQRFI
jgi:formylmethanofuran dehydrogenase subunit E